MTGQNDPQDRSPDDPSRLVDEQTHNHGTKQFADAEPGVLTAYRTDVLLLPTAAVADIGGLNALLAGAGLTRPFGDPLPGGAGRFTPVRVAAGNALEVWGAIRAQASGRAGAAAVAGGASPDRLVSADTLSVAPGGPVSTLAGSKQGHGDPGRVPVTLHLAAPPGPPFTGRRRPVVAVLDTAVAPHRWWADAPADDRFVVDAEEELEWRPGPSPVAAPAGGVGRYTGHGTFIAGLIRQQAPAARVLSVRIMHDDGVVYASEVLRALTWLRDGLGGDTPDRVADVVLMAFGYRARHPEDDQHTAELRTLIWELADAGVQVVASAGNDGSGEQTFPAAFAADLEPPATPVISVGATNPNCTDAHYSNHGGWVTRRRVGTGVISAMPAVAGDLPPAPSNFAEQFGETLDPDDFTGGFARWSGTSFAAAVFAGQCAQAILDGAPAPRS